MKCNKLTLKFIPKLLMYLEKEKKIKQNLITINNP